MVREDVDHPVAIAEHVVDHAEERPLRPHLDEDARTGFVQRLEAAHELHRRGDLPPEQLDHLRHDTGPHRIEATGDVGDDRHLGRVHVERGQDALERCARRGDDMGVECVADGQRNRPVVRLVERRGDPVHRFGRPPDDRLLVAIDIGDDEIATVLGDDALDLRDRGEDGEHGAVIGDRDLAHLGAAGADRSERVAEVHRTGGHEGAVFAQAVTHHHVGRDAVRPEQSTERGIDREHRRLGHLGLPQVVVGGRHRLVVVGIDEDERGQRAAEQRRHRAVGLGEGGAHDGIAVPQRPDHVDVLRALARIEKRHLRRRSPTPEDAQGPQRLPHAGMVGVERLARLGALRGQLRCVGVVDRDAVRGTQVVFGR